MSLCLPDHSTCDCYESKPDNNTEERCNDCSLKIEDCFCHTEPDNNTALSQKITKAIDSLDWSQAEFGMTPSDEDYINALLPLFQEHSTARVVEAVNRLVVGQGVYPEDRSYGHGDFYHVPVSEFSELLRELESNTKERES